MADVTTTKNMKGPQGQYCRVCGQKVAVGRLGPKGFTCPDCDTRPVLVEEVKDESASK